MGISMWHLLTLTDCNLESIIPYVKKTHMGFGAGCYAGMFPLTFLTMWQMILGHLFTERYNQPELVQTWNRQIWLRFSDHFIQYSPTDLMTVMSLHSLKVYVSWQTVAIFRALWDRSDSVCISVYPFVFGLLFNCSFLYSIMCYS